MRAAAHREDFREHIQSLRRYALQLTRSRDQADDLVQECLARALAAAPVLKPGLPVRPWLFRILHNVHISEQRKLKVRRENVPSATGDAMAPQQYHRSELRAVLDAMAQLPQEQAVVIHLVAIEGMSYAEAARVLDIPLGTLTSRLARGREGLRELLRAPEVARLHVVGGRDDR